MNIATAWVEVRANTAAGRREAVAGAKKISDDVAATVERGNKQQVASAQRTADQQVAAAKRAGQEVRQEHDKTVKKAKSAAQQIGEFFAAGVFLKGVNDTVNAASRLQQSVGATEAVFKGAESTIDSFATTSADAFGISNAAARELTATIGSLLKGFGFTTDEAATTSVQLAKLGADLSATFGGKPEDAVAALGAALRGEFDPLEQFGVSLNVAQANLRAVELGLAKSTSSVDMNARAQGALSLIMERSAAAQGQFGREADTYAGQQARASAAAEDAKAKFGEQLLPVMTRVQQVAGFLAERFGDLPGPIQLAAVGLVGFVALAGPLQTLAGNAGDVVDALKKMSTAGVAASAAAAGVAAAVVIGYLAYQSYTAKAREVTARAKDVAGALGEATSAALENADAANSAATANVALSNALANTGEDGKKLTTALGTLGLTSADALDTLLAFAKDPVSAISSLATQLGATTEQADRLAYVVNTFDGGNLADAYKLIYNEDLPPNLAAVASALEEVQDQSEKTNLDKVLRDFLGTDAAASDLRQSLLAQAEAQTGVQRTGEGLLPLYEAYTTLLVANKDKLGDTTTATAKYGGEVVKLGKAQAETKKKTNELTEAMGPFTRVFGLADQNASDLAKSLDEVFGRYTSLEEGTRGLEAAHDDLSASIKENGKTLDIGTEKGRANREAIQKSTESIDTWAEAYVNAGHSPDEAAAGINAFTANLRDQLIQSGFTEQAVDEYLQTLGRTPENVQTT